MRYGLLNDIRKLDKQRYPLMIERFMALAFEPGVELPKPHPQPRLRIDDGSRQAALDKFALSLDRPVLALCPGAEFRRRPSAGRRNTTPRSPRRRSVPAGGSGCSARRTTIPVERRFASA